MKVDKKKKPEQQENSRNNKGQFKKGMSGNPAGRNPKEKCIPDLLRKLCADPSLIDPKIKQTRLEAICSVAIAQAETGDKDARNWVADRMEGKAIERVINKEDFDELIIIG